jgi:D-threonate/D-erythronate kinase
MTGLRMLADDLTGALDTAAAFSGQREVPVFLAPPPPGTGDAALDLACRDGGEAEAVAAVTAAAPLLTGADIAYLKIDSLLRGHWAAMLAALWRTGLFRSCVLAPAFPAQGRVTVGGRQCLRAADGTLSSLAVDPAAALAVYGVTLGVGLRMSDAQSEADLRAIAAQRPEAPVLWVGTAGLATALAGAAPPRITDLPGPALALIGSAHAVSLAQIDGAGCAPAWLNGAEDGDASVGERLRAHGACLVQADISPGTAPADAARIIRARFAALLDRLAPPGTLIVAGGETLRGVAESLGVTHIAVEGEVMPGIPASRLRGGAWDGVRLVSKSGAFGGPDLLRRVFALAGGSGHT